MVVDGQCRCIDADGNVLSEMERLRRLGL